MVLYTVHILRDHLHAQMAQHTVHMLRDHLHAQMAQHTVHMPRDQLHVQMALCVVHILRDHLHAQMAQHTVHILIKEISSMPEMASNFRPPNFIDLSTEYIKLCYCWQIGYHLGF